MPNFDVIGHCVKKRVTELTNWEAATKIRIVIRRGLIPNNAGIEYYDTGVQSKNASPHHVCLVVSMSAYHAVGRRFVPQSIHTKDHYEIGTNCLPAWHACIRVRM